MKIQAGCGGNLTQEASNSAKYAQCAEQKNLLSIALKYDPTLTIWLMRTLSQMEAKNNDC